MAWHRLEHARSRVNELERIKNKHLHRTTNSQRPAAQAPAGASAQPANPPAQ